MKILPTLCLLMLISVMSCSKEESIDQGNDGTDFFECKIDGTDYKITGDGAFASKIADDLFSIYGNENLGQGGDLSVYISLSKEPSAGTYELKDADIGVGTYLSISNGSPYISAVNGNGEISITEKSADRIVGTFEYTAVNANGETKIITDGKFDVAIK